MCSQSYYKSVMTSNSVLPHDIKQEREVGGKVINAGNYRTPSISPIASWAGPRLFSRDLEALHHVATAHSASLAPDLNHLQLVVQVHPVFFNCALPRPHSSQLASKNPLKEISRWLILAPDLSS